MVKLNFIRELIIDLLASLYKSWKTHKLLAYFFPSLALIISISSFILTNTVYEKYGYALLSTIGAFIAVAFVGQTIEVFKYDRKIITLNKMKTKIDAILHQPTTDNQIINEIDENLVLEKNLESEIIIDLYKEAFKELMK